MQDGSESLPSDFDDHLTALEGIKIMLNNGFRDSEKMFNKMKDSSPQMSAGASFVSFLNGMMTFDDEKLALAVQELKATQKLCAIPDETLNNLKAKLSRRTTQRLLPSLSTVLQNKIIIADCHLYLALICFIQQDITGYLKGGWILRKAWKIYEKLYEQIGAMCKLSQQVTDSNANGNAGQLQPPKTAHEQKMREQLNSISVPTLNRLYGSVSFGFGLFNLCVSLIPQKLLKVVNMIGFHGDRDVGLVALQYASKSEDMKAPLAMLALLWYHTVVRPFFAVDGDRSDVGIPSAEAIMAENEALYPTSSFVLFFKGRIQRCKRNISGALNSFQSSYDAAVEQRELQLMCAYEIGWCALMELDWAKALEFFTLLKDESKWSTCYYTYLTALMTGITGDKSECIQLFSEVPKAMKRKGNQLEIYIVRKAKTFLKTPVVYEYLLLYTLELLYLWRALSNCTPESLSKMLQECDKVTNVSLQGLKNLILGGIYKSLDDTARACDCFRNAMKLSDRDFEDGHIAPYACYELATILMNGTETRVKGLQLFKHCKENYEGYDFENRLNMRIHATEHRMSKDS